MRRERITITIRSDVLKKLDTVIDGEKIRNRSNAIETIILDKFGNRILKTAVIFAADSQEITMNGKVTSKILFSLGNKLLIEENIETLKKVGVDTLFISVGKLREQVEKIIGDGRKFGMKIKYLEQFNGTGGVLRDLEKNLKETFLAANGDILLDKIDLEDMYLFHKKLGGVATLAVATIDDPSKLGNIYVKGNLITDFKEKIADTEEQSHLVSGGIYIFEPEMVKSVPEGYQMLENDIFPKLAQQKKIFGYNIGKEWVHLHDEEKLKEFLKKVFKIS